jgi:hypothetical protein
MQGLSTNLYGPAFATPSNLITIGASGATGPVGSISSRIVGGAGVLDLSTIVDGYGAKILLEILATTTVNTPGDGKKLTIKLAYWSDGTISTANAPSYLADVASSYVVTLPNAVTTKRLVFDLGTITGRYLYYWYDLDALGNSTAKVSLTARVIPVSGVKSDVQDLGVTWTPANIALGNLLGFATAANLSSVTTLTFLGTGSVGGFSLAGITGLTSASWPNLLSCSANFSLTGATALTAFSAPKLATVTGNLTLTGNTSLVTLSLPALATVTGNFVASGNTALTTVSLPAYLPTNGCTIDASGCALTAASVNAILARCVANTAFVTGTVTLNGGTNAAPTGQGATDVTTLIERGVSVTVTT